MTATSGLPRILNRPTDLASFTNGPGYVTTSTQTTQVQSDWNATTAPAAILNKPTTLSQFTNNLTGAPGSFTLGGNLILPAFTYPVVPLTTNSTAGNVASASSIYNGGAAYQAFYGFSSTGISNYWSQGVNDQFTNGVSTNTTTTYATSIYYGASTTTASGPWLQLQLPYSVPTPVSYYMQGTTTVYSPTAWVFMGSADGSTWFGIDTQSGTSFSYYPGTTYACSSAVSNGTAQVSYMYYRWVFTAANTTIIRMTHIRLNGAAPQFSGRYLDLIGLPSLATTGQVQANWTETTSTAIDYIANKPTLAAVATTGAYSSLSGVPTIPTIQSGCAITNSSGVASVPFATAFPAAPCVVCTVYLGSSSEIITVQLNSVSTTGFTCTTYYDQGMTFNTAGSQEFTWMALEFTQ